MGIQQSYSSMSRSELEAARAEKIDRLSSAQNEIRKLKKKFKSGHYDRQIVCEHIISWQHQMTGLIASIEGINRILEAELVAPTQS